MSEQGMREIQVSAKQLVFLFMASVVVAVGIFLLGVSVGRGVHGPMPAQVSAMSGANDSVGPPDNPPASASVASGATTLKPNELTYPGRLSGPAPGRAGVAPGPASAVTSSAGADGANPAAGVPPAPPAPIPAAPAVKTAPVKPVPASTPPAREGATASKPAPTPAASLSKPDTTKPSTAASSGWMLQFDAFRSRSNADVEVADLKSKGYQAFVLESSPFFIVRMGPYANKADADAMASTLVKEGYKPFVKH